MSFIDVMMIGVIVLAIVAGGLYFLNKKATAKMGEAESFIKQNKQLTSIFVIEKKRDKITNVNMPKLVMDQVPFYQKILKNYFVQAKVGPQIITLMCDKTVFNALTEKKNIKVELAGIYIVKVVGMKSKEEMKDIEKQKKIEKKKNKK